MLPRATPPLGLALVVELLLRKVYYLLVPLADSWPYISLPQLLALFP